MRISVHTASLLALLNEIGSVTHKTSKPTANILIANKASYAFDVVTNSYGNVFQNATKIAALCVHSRPISALTFTVKGVALTITPRMAKLSGSQLDKYQDLLTIRLVSAPVTSHIATINLQPLNFF
jgi:hypothetical protein